MVSVCMCCSKNTTPAEEADPKAEENKIDVKDLDKVPTPKK